MAARKICTTMEYDVQSISALIGIVLVVIMVFLSLLIYCSYCLNPVLYLILSSSSFLTHTNLDWTYENFLISLINVD